MPPRRKERINLPLSERIKDGRIFEVSKRTKNGVIYLRCQTKFCAGTAKKEANGEIVLHRKHSAICYEDKNAQTIADFKQALKSTLERHFWRLKVLYETVAAMFPREAKVLLPYQSILSSLKRWRRRLFPPCPKNVEEMAQQLAKPENQQLFEYDAGRLDSKRIVDSAGKVHLLIYDPQLIASEFLNLLRLFIDGTFQTTPKIRGVYQLVSVLGIKYNHAFPFVHILMASKTQSAYTAVLSQLRELINCDSVQLVMTDFEQALRNASVGVFPNALVTGCNVHYDRALLRKIKTLGMATLIRDNAEAKTFLKKVMALAYLPEEHIHREYQTLKTGLTPAMRRSFSSFMTYYDRQWLQTVKPAGFSVFGLARRTNNVIESYNSVLADKLGKHPSAWTFMAKLVKLTSNVRDDLRSLSLSKRIKRHPRYASIYKQRELMKAWKQLYSREESPSEFLTRAAMLKGHVSQRIANLPEEPPDYEPQMAEPANVGPAVNDIDYEHRLFEDLRLEENEHDDDPAVSDHSGHDESDMDESVGSEEETDGGSDEDSDIDALERPISPRHDPPNETPADAGSFVNNVEEMDAPELPANPINDPLDLTLSDAETFINNDDAAEEIDPPERSIFPMGDHVRVREDAPIQAMEIVEVLSSSEDSGTVQESGPIVAPDDGNTIRPANTNGTNDVSRSRKKNLRKKRRQQLKAQAEAVGVQARPYGHKRRRNKTKNKKGPKCVVCLAEEVSHTFVPCGHHCCCVRCAEVIAASSVKRCPKCRAPYTQVIVTYTEDSQ